MHAQGQRGFVQHGQRAHGQAGLHGGVFNGGGGDAFAQHGGAFHHKGAEGAAGVETARVVDHDGHFAQGLHVVEGAGHGFVVRLFAADDLHQLHLVHGAEEVDADKLLGPAAGRGQAADGQGGGVAGKEAAGRELRLGFLCDLGLEVTAFKHGFDDEVAARQVGRAGGGRDAGQQGLLRLGRHAALVHAGLGEFGAVGLAGFGLLHTHVLEHGGNAPARLGPGDARTHHARAQDADLLRLVAGSHSSIDSGARLAALDRVHIEEERVDHVARHGAGHQAGEVAAFDAQGGVVVHHRAFDHGGESCLGRGVAAARGLLEHGGRNGEGACNLGVGRRAAGHFVVLVVPRLHRVRVGGDVGQSGGQQLLARGDQFVHQLQFQRLGGVEELAFQDVGLRAHQAQQARHLGHAGGAGHQAQRDLGQAELDLGVGHGDAVVGDQGHFPATAQRRAIEAGHHRDAQRFERAEVLLHALDFAENGRSIRRCQAHGGLEVGARKEAGLGRCQHDAFEGSAQAFAVTQHLCSDLAQLLLPLAAHGVDGGVGFVKRDDGDLAFVALGGDEFVANGLHDVLVSCPFRYVQQSLRCPCRRPRTAWPGHSAGPCGAARQSGCPGSWRLWRPAGGPWRWRRRSR